MMDFHSWPVILTYHSISAGHGPLCTRPELFAEQMAWLAASGHPVIPLAELTDALAGKLAFPRRAVVLTFDDGFQDFYEAAFPILRQFGFPSTLFLVTRFCGGTNRWPGQPAYVEELPLLGWRQVQELACQGVKFGAHSDTHPDLSQLPPGALKLEILASKKELEAQIGQPADFFCYPYGRYNQQARAIVSQHFRGACSANMQRVRPESDLFCLPRIDAFYLRSAVVFRQLFTRRGTFYLGLRSVLRALRARCGTTLSSRR